MTANYVYLLGLYVGDGTIAFNGRHGRVHERGRAGARLLESGWNGWPELFPQHGVGKKHTRPIVLAGWQRALADAHPQELLRGLIHSDGCRVVNRFSIDLPSGRRAGIRISALLLLQPVL